MAEPLSSVRASLIRRSMLWIFCSRLTCRSSAHAARIVGLLYCMRRRSGQALAKNTCGEITRPSIPVLVNASRIFEAGIAAFMAQIIALRPRLDPPELTILALQCGLTGGSHE